MLLMLTILIMLGLAIASPNPECGLNPAWMKEVTGKDALGRYNATCFDEGGYVVSYRDKYPVIQVYCYNKRNDETDRR